MDHQDNADAKATSVDEAGLSSSPDSLNERPDVSGEGINTVDVDPVKDIAGDAAPGQKAEADAAAQAAADAAKDGETGDDKDTGKKGQEGRFDKDPDWQRMKTERDEAILKAAKLEGIIEASTQLKGGAQDAQGAPAPAVPYKDITKMSKEELLEWFEDDPIGYEANRFAQFQHEMEIITAQKADSAKRTNTIKETFDNYEKDNPDFKAKWETGEIKKFMETHPGHNAISAHMMMAQESTAAAEAERTKAAVDTAVKANTEKLQADFKAKRNAGTIGDGTGGVGATPPGDVLKDTKSQGGLVSAIAARLSARRQAAGGG